MINSGNLFTDCTLSYLIKKIALPAINEGKKNQSRQNEFSFDVFISVLLAPITSNNLEGISNNAWKICHDPKI